MKGLQVTTRTSIIIAGAFIFLLCVLYFVFYNSSARSRSSPPKETYDIYGINTHNKNTNIWYGLNATGGYRDYGREYGGRFSPGRVYNSGAYGAHQDQSHTNGGCANH